jgi:glucose-1-phosphate thymidylyltransferase
MRALVLSGGEGSRLRPITHTIGQTGAEVRAAVGDGSRWGLDVTYIEQDAPLGIAHAVMTASEFVRGEPFLMYLGDNVLLEGVDRFVRGFERTRPDAQILLTRVPEPEHFGVAVLEGERVVRLVEKPREFVSDVALVGVYLFDDSILEACATLTPSWRGEYEITEAIQWLIDHDRTVRAEMVDGYWKDTGRPEDLLEANRMMLGSHVTSIEGDVDAATTIDGAVTIASGATVTRSRLHGPVVIGPGCVVDDATLGPDVSLEPGCEVARSTIRDSILMQGCRVLDVDELVSSILGRNVVVRHSGSVRAHRLVVGDQSVVEVD